MPASRPFKLSRSGLLLALVSAAFANQASGAAGRAEFTIGGVTIARGGVERPLTRGTELDNGDTVRTNNGRAQIRFTDGAYVSLQPNTEYSIRDYQYTQGSERGFFSLLKGAMRTVTGAIGRINRDRYQIATPTATVGIRGTGGVIQVQDDGSTLVVGTSGIWSLTNPAGSVDVPGGTSAVAPSDPNQPPQETTQQPTSGPAPVPEDEPIFVAGDERTNEGLPIIPQPSILTSGSGYFSVLAFDAGVGTEVFPVGGNAQFDADGRLTELSDASGQLFKLDPATGVHADFGTDGILAWGRWTGLVSGAYDFDGVLPFSATYSANQGFHYVVGMPTTSMPTTGSATYALLGASRPTYVSDIGVAPGAFTGSLSVNFGALSVGVNLNIVMPDTTYAIGGSATLAGPTFVGVEGQALTTTSPNGGCQSGCNSLVVGFFAGSTAERAGLGYHVNDFLANKDVLGTAAFQKQ
jgi:hypothetical protein